MGLREWYVRHKLNEQIRLWQIKLDAERKALDSGKEDGMGKWLQTILVVFAGGALTALSDALLNGFTVDSAGAKRVVLAAVAGGVIALAAYLKQSPLPKPPAPPAALLVLMCLGLMTGCGSLAQVRLGAEPKMHPDEKVVFARVCANEENAARLYLESPTFAWIGPVKERYLTDALMKKFAGECPCPGKECPKLEGSK